MRRFEFACSAILGDDEWPEYFYVNAGTAQEAYDVFRKTPLHVIKETSMSFLTNMVDVASQEVFWINSNTDKVFSCSIDWVASYSSEEYETRLHLEDVLTIVYE